MQSDSGVATAYQPSRISVFSWHSKLLIQISAFFYQDSSSTKYTAL